MTKRLAFCLRSACTIISTSSLKCVSDRQPKLLRALLASPTRCSTSGRTIELGCCLYTDDTPEVPGFGYEVLALPSSHSCRRLEGAVHEFAD